MRLNNDGELYKKARLINFVNLISNTKLIFNKIYKKNI